MSTNNDVKIGIVSNCKELNIRNGPSLCDEVNFVLNADDTVIIHESLCNKKWLRISDDMNRDGYCMARYVFIVDEDDNGEEWGD